MVDSQADRDPVEVLAAEFVERLRLGEDPSVDEYAAKYPELADEIRELFPTIAAMENLKSPKDALSSGQTPLGTMKLDRLGDFHIIRELGRGGMGIVYEARQESLERTVAVKVLPKLVLLDPKHLQRFEREARTAAGLHHTNIVPVFGVGHQDDFHYYVMQCIEGAGLDRVLARLEHTKTTSQNSDIQNIVSELATTVGSPNETQVANAKQNQSPSQKSSSVSFSFDADLTTPFPYKPVTAEPVEEDLPTETQKTATKKTEAKDSSYWNNVAQIGAQVARALEYAHSKGVLHRDIKPANLIVDTQGVVWVADFGLAKALEQDHISRSGDILGTPAYMAPEQLHGETDFRSDIYSLGITLYELLTLRSAFPEKNRARLLERIATEEPARPRQVRPKIPRDLETIVLKAIAHEPKRRYQTAGELATDLQCFLEDRPIQARRASSVERLWRWCRRNPIVAGLTVTAVTLLLLVAVTASVGYARTARALAAEQIQRQRAEAATKLALQVLDRIYERFAPPGIENITSEDGPENDRFRKPALSEGTAAVLEDMLTFYDRLAEQNGNDGKYLEEIALANRRVGDIRHHLGQLEEAKNAYEQAIELYSQLDRENSKKHLFERAVLCTELGIIFGRLQEHQKAVAMWEMALEMLKKVEPSSEQLRRAIKRTEGFLRGPERERRTPSQEPFGPPPPQERPGLPRPLGPPRPLF